MSIALLQKHLPENSLAYLKNWFSDYSIHIKITKNRNSKLGDYRKMPDRTHQITINSTLQPQLFFFVLTHELAHLVAFEKFGRGISPHGKEWKQTFREMLVESLSVYSQDLRPIILNFSISPKANFMASPGLVKYFHIDSCLDGDRAIFIEELAPGNKFVYKGQTYLLEEKRKINYLCRNIVTGKKYLFKPLASVKKV